MTRPRIFVTAVPFASVTEDAPRLLTGAGLDFFTNPRDRTLTETELSELVGESDGVIAGTDPFSRAVIAAAPNLKIIARVGSGLDSVDLSAARETGVLVTYTPEAPAPAVAELAVCQMLALLRDTYRCVNQMRDKKWDRHTGRRLAEMKVGIIGAGRIGGRVINHLAAFGPPEIYVSDLREPTELQLAAPVRQTDIDTIFRTCDVVSLHVPLNNATRGLADAKRVASMKENAILINTARGPVVDSAALAQVLRRRPDLSAAIDVFDVEPYSGELCELPNCFCTSHLGANTRDCRNRMEVEAAREIVRFFRQEPPLHPAPEVV